MKKAAPSRLPARPQAPEPAGGTRPWLIFSLSLNFGLLLFLFWGRENPPPSAAPLPDALHASRRPPKVQARPAASRTASAAPWRRLEADDPAVYAANLRAAGCPPKTVRDILLPAFEKQFAPPVSGPVRFWASFSERQMAAAAQAEQAGTLGRQRDRALEASLGFAWNSAGLSRAGSAEAAGAAGFLDYERAEKFLCVADRFQEPPARADFSPQTDRRLALYQTWSQEAGGVLSPAELEEAELRDILLNWQRHHPLLCRAGLSGTELRQLMAFRREQFHPLPSALLTGNNTLPEEPDEVAEQPFQRQARALLGDARFIDYLKGCDAAFERTLTALETAQLPRNLALPLFDLRQEAMMRAQAIRQLPAHRAEKRAQLAALREDTLARLAPLANTAPGRPLLEISQDWLQEIARP